MDGTWDDYDSDGIYGEANVDDVSENDEGDLGFDVVVGRICARNSEQALGYINKVIEYETNPPDIMDKFIMGGAIGWDWYSGTDRTPHKRGGAAKKGDGFISVGFPTYPTVSLNRAFYYVRRRLLFYLMAYYICLFCLLLLR